MPRAGNELGHVIDLDGCKGHGQGQVSLEYQRVMARFCMGATSLGAFLFIMFGPTVF